MKKIILGLFVSILCFSNIYANYDFKNFNGFNINSYINKTIYTIKNGSIYNDDCETVCLEDIYNATFIDNKNYSIKIYRDLKKVFTDLDITKVKFLNEAQKNVIFPAIDLYKEIVNSSESLTILTSGKKSISINGTENGKEKILSAEKIIKDKKVIGVGYLYIKENGATIEEKYFYKIVSLSKEGESYIEISKNIFDLKSILSKKNIEKINYSFIKKDKNYIAKIQNKLNNFVVKNKKTQANIKTFKNTFILNY